MAHLKKEDKDLHEHALKLIRLLKGRKYDIHSPIYTKVTDFIPLLLESNFKPTSIEVRYLRQTLQEAFSLSDEEIAEIFGGGVVSEPPLLGTVSNAASEAELINLCTRSAYLSKYLKYTENNEAPVGFHVFNALAGVSVCLNNKLYYDMSFYKLYPALSIILLGPSGVKKTTAGYVIIDLLTEGKCCAFYSEKTTPEAFAQAMTYNPTGFVFAGELAAMLGRQRYLEGFVPLLTRLLDHRTFEIETKHEGKSIILNPAPTFVGCSTLDWFISNTPEDTFGGGFMARQLLVYQQDSTRVVSSPGRDRNGQWINKTHIQALREELIQMLVGLQQVKGEASFTTTEAFQYYDTWYRTNKEIAMKRDDKDPMSTYYQRKPDHVKRIALCLHAIDHHEPGICLDCFTLALNILNWSEAFLPNVFKTMFRSPEAKDRDLILSYLIEAQGVIEHAQLLRKVAYKINATRLRKVIDDLVQAQLVLEEKTSLAHSYMYIGPK